MKSLETIQKTFHIFEILTKIAFIFCIIGAAGCALGSLFAVTALAGRQVFSLFGEPVTIFSTGAGMRETMAVLLAETVILTTQAILLGFGLQYFKTEQDAGTPFTGNGAQLLERLGIRCIWMPMVAAAIAAVITACFEAERGTELSDLPSVATGIVLILVSVIFRYGAELEQQVHTVISGGEH